MHAEPLWLFLALAAGGILSLIWAGVVFGILYLVATLPELAPRPDETHDLADLA